MPSGWATGSSSGSAPGGARPPWATRRGSRHERACQERAGAPLVVGGRCPSWSDFPAGASPPPLVRPRRASTGPQLLPRTIPGAAGIRAFYFRDPDGHPLEVLQFPRDKGDPKWHAPSDRLFLGIDHTAIVVSDTRTSLAFYRDLLGFRVA